MYCPSCGVVVTHKLNYCSRCGGNLSSVKEEDEETPSNAIELLLEGIFWVTVFGLGIILGGIAALKALGVRDAFIAAYMILSALAFLGVYIAYFWQLILANRDLRKMNNITPSEKFHTNELETAKLRALPDPVPSITEDTTQMLEPEYQRRKGIEKNF